MQRYIYIPSKTSKTFFCTKSHTGRTGSRKRGKEEGLPGGISLPVTMEVRLPKKHPGKI